MLLMLDLLAFHKEILKQYHRFLSLNIMSDTMYDYKHMYHSIVYVVFLKSFMLLQTSL